MSETPKPPNNHSGRERLRRFWASASGFWRGRSALTSWPLTVGLMIVAISQLAVQYRLNYWNRDFFNALGRRDAAGLIEQIVIFAPLAVLSVALSVASVWARMTTQRKWRQWLTTHILDTWLTRERHRRLDTGSNETQNAEYRISFDARSSTDAPVDLALGIFNSALTAFVFIGVLWDVGGGITIPVGPFGLTVPGYLVIAVVIYAVAFTGAMMAIGRNLPVIIQNETQGEAELLAAANQVRVSGETNNGTGSDDSEQHRLVWEALKQALVRWRQLCWQLMGTTLVSQTDLLFAPVFAWVLCAPKYLNGQMTLGELTQASAAFVTVQVAFNWLVDNYGRLSDWRSAVNRVATLLMALDTVVAKENMPAAQPATLDQTGSNLTGSNQTASNRPVPDRTASNRGSP